MGSSATTATVVLGATVDTSIRSTVIAARHESLCPISGIEILWKLTDSRRSSLPELGPSDYVGGYEADFGIGKIHDTW
jgi:hypothetical protein